MSLDALKYDSGEGGEDPTWGDYGRAAGSTAAGIGAGSAGLMRAMFEAGGSPEAAKVFRGLQTAARNAGDDIEEGMTEEGRARNAAGVTSAKFWEHPVSSLALKATGMSPYLLAAALPGTLIADGAAAMAATTAAGGVLSAGDLIDEITKKPDQMSDEALKKIPIYAQFRDAGDDERTARDKYNQLIVGAKPAIAFVLGAGEGLFGPAAQLVRGAKGAVRHGIGKAALEGGASELADEVGAAILAQKAEIEGGTRKDYDASEILDRGLTGMVLGAGFGGVSGIGGGHGKGKAKADEIRDKRAGADDADVQAPAVEDQVAAGAQGQPATGAKAKAAEEKGVTVGVDPAVREALEDKTQAAPAPQQPVEPPVPAAPAQPPAQPPAPPAPPPQAVQPQQAPTVPRRGLLRELLRK